MKHFPAISSILLAFGVFALLIFGNSQIIDRNIEINRLQDHLSDAELISEYGFDRLIPGMSEDEVFDIIPHHHRQSVTEWTGDQSGCKYEFGHDNIRHIFILFDGSCFSKARIFDPVAGRYVDIKPITS